MNRRRNRTGRRLNRPRPPRVSSTIVNGIRYRGSNDPPSVTENPWNTLIAENLFSLDSLNFGKLARQNLWAYFADRFKLPDVDSDGDPFTLFVRVQRVSVYLMDDDANTVLHFQPGVITNGVPEASIGAFRDSPGKNQYASIHFAYPKVFQARPYPVSPYGEPVDDWEYGTVWLEENASVSVKREVMVRSHILWKFNTEKAFAGRSLTSPKRSVDSHTTEYLSTPV